MKTQLAAVVAPGYGGTSEQPIVKAMVHRLEAAGIQARPVSYSRARPSGIFAQELEDVRKTRDELLAGSASRVALVGRSFGARICARLAALEPPAALVLLGHPIAPRGRPRPDDEAALEAVRCPTLIVQGDHDALGPLSALERIANINTLIEMYVLREAGHQFGARQAEGLDRAVAWLLALG